MSFSSSSFFPFFPFDCKLIIRTIVIYCVCSQTVGCPSRASVGLRKCAVVRCGPLSAVVLIQRHAPLLLWAHEVQLGWSDVWY